MALLERFINSRRTQGISFFRAYERISNDRVTARTVELVNVLFEFVIKIKSIQNFNNNLPNCTTESDYASYVFRSGNNNLPNVGFRFIAI